MNYTRAKCICKLKHTMAIVQISIPATKRQAFCDCMHAKVVFVDICSSLLSQVLSSVLSSVVSI